MTNGTGAGSTVTTSIVDELPYMVTGLRTLCVWWCSRAAERVEERSRLSLML